MYKRQELFKEQVLEPLGMMNSLFLPYPSKRIVPTQQLASGEVLRGITHDPKARVLAEHAGNAGLFIDLEDSIKFVKMYLDKGKTANGQLDVYKRQLHSRYDFRSREPNCIHDICDADFD